MKSICLLLVALCLASVNSLRYNGNVSFSGSNNGWSYRNTNLFVLPTVGVLYSSTSANQNSNGYNVSGLFGAGVLAQGTVPYTFAASWTSTSAFGAFGQGWLSANVSGSLGYVAGAYLRIEERASDNSVVSSNSLVASDAFGVTPGIKYQQDSTYTTDTLRSASFVGTPSSGSWNINITFVASSIVGVLDLANAVVGPSSFETIVQINNWQYQSASNHLALVMLTVTGSGSVAADGAVTSVSSGSGSNQIYFSAAQSAVVNGKTQAVNVNVNTATQTDISALNKNRLLSAQIETKFSAATFNTVTVDFPAGASSIAYDPSVGSGQPLPAGSNSSPATSVVVSFSALLFALLAMLL